jgi:hypothetical protein
MKQWVLKEHSMATINSARGWLCSMEGISPIGIWDHVTERIMDYV